MDHAAIRRAVFELRDRAAAFGRDADALLAALDDNGSAAGAALTLELISVKEAVARTQLNRKTISRWARDRGIGVSVADRNMIDAAGLEEQCRRHCPPVPYQKSHRGP